MEQRWHCALPFGASARRAVALIGPRLKPWRLYYADRLSDSENKSLGAWAQYLGGEGYWAASLDYVLRQLGFEVDFYGHVEHGGKYPDVLPNASIFGGTNGTRRYHRIIIDSVGAPRWS